MRRQGLPPLSFADRGCICIEYSSKCGQGLPSQSRVFRNCIRIELVRTGAAFLNAMRTWTIEPYRECVCVSGNDREKLCFYRTCRGRHVAGRPCRRNYRYCVKLVTAPSVERVVNDL